MSAVIYVFWMLAALGVIGLLAWAHQLATKRGRPGVAGAIVVLSWALFAVTMVANGQAHQQTWQ